MIFIYLLSFFALLPIFAYLLNQGTANKGYIIGISTIIIFLCIFSFIGKFSYLGFFEEQVLTNEMKDDIKNDTSISTATLNKFEQLIEDENKIYFLPEQRENLNNMLNVLDKAFAEMNTNLSSEYGHISIENAKKYEREINQIRNDLRKSYLEQAEKGEYKFQPGVMYNDLFSSCEKVGDHIINVSEAVAGEI